ncbi:uncharacterized protein N7484_003661 [Penicillium longicatenatum]|uniref:uncharacterized protein n=1 Tax=Penicillium longicatenatum TaxID=1561947 RepID=UPI002549275A|nr:uncharacterized protein N7484_003661 [Penicillium longicatenatum]KAJ5649938.1 hypothetical protein N7484_003661 [Penicillium longicatenatum]
MSDDEDYYDFEEEYIYEDAVPDLVDELAASSWYEAALYEDPGIEVEDYFSDWDYYSDDYHDDDPTVAQSRPPTKIEPAVTKTKKGRTHAAARPHHPLKLDIASFQGVVWKTDSLERDKDVSVQIYEPGQLDKVAFLQDWREVFKSAQPALDKSRLRKRRAPEPQASDTSGDDEILNDADEEYSDEDPMSDVESLDQDGSVELGEGSNTTPEPGQSPKENPRIAVEIPVKRGRKRKAEAPTPVKETKSNPNDNSTRSRSKRVALDKSEEEASSSGPVRRSARQKK